MYLSQLQIALKNLFFLSKCNLRKRTIGSNCQAIHFLIQKCNCCSSRLYVFSTHNQTNVWLVKERERKFENTIWHFQEDVGGKQNMVLTLCNKLKKLPRSICNEGSLKTFLTFLIFGK